MPKALERVATYGGGVLKSSSGAFSSCDEEEGEEEAESDEGEWDF